MSVNYNPPAGGYTGPTGKVNFSWLGESWQIFTEAAGIWIGSCLIHGFIYLALYALIVIAFPDPSSSHSAGLFGRGAGKSGPDISAIGGILGLIFMLGWSAFFTASSSRLAIKQLRGEPVSFSDAFSGGPYVANFLVFLIIYVIFALGGMIALCVGMFFTIGLLMPMMAMIADDMPVSLALTRSIEGMKSDWLMAGLFVFVFLLIKGVLGWCILPVLATTPMLYIISALAYRDMVGMSGSVRAPYGGSRPTPSIYGNPQQPGVWPPPPGEPLGQQYGQPGQPPPPQFGQPPYPIQPPPAQFGQPPYPVQPVPPQFGQSLNPGEQPAPQYAQPYQPQYSEPQYGWSETKPISEEPPGDDTSPDSGVSR